MWQYLLLFILLISSQENKEVGERIYPTRYKKNINLESFEVHQTYKLSTGEYILIAKKNTEDATIEGYRILLLNYDSISRKYKIDYKSRSKGEAYVYNPYFYQFSDSSIIIIAEEGYEYMSGFDIYRLKDSEIKFIGHVSASGDFRDSIIPQIQIEKNNKEYIISFKGKIEYKVGSDNLMDGSNLKAVFDADNFNIKKE